MPLRLRLLCLFLLASVPSFWGATPPPAPEHFKTAVYITVGVVERMKDPVWLEESWKQLNSQVHVDKVYIETYRSGLIADEALLDQVKAFFQAHGVEVAGGIAYVAGGDNVGRLGAIEELATTEPGQFVSLSYTNAEHRALVKHVAELTARHFDEIILDDFFFNNTKTNADIAAKGAASWSQFRLRLMDEVSQDLVVGPARTVNPKVRVIIKFPNWYEHFQANGYDLQGEPKIFDGIYTGTETRDPENNDQHLQQYESYEAVRYFENIAPGRNGGGWVDTYGTRSVDRYAEQLWDTMLAKAPQILLFQYSDLLNKAQMGERGPWEALPTTFQTSELSQWSQHTGGPAAPSWAAVAGYSLSKVNAVLGHLGKPVALASYKPFHSTGEDFLQNYLGMIGIPVEMHPEFPEGEKTVLLTAQAAQDTQIVAKMKKHLEAGGNVVITSGLLQALQGKGIEEIAEIACTGNVLRVRDYWGASGAGAGASLGATEEILVPEIAFMTNDAWPVVRGTASGRGAPLLLQDHYSKGNFYVLSIPENASDLYALPQPVLTSIRHYLLRGQPYEIDAPSRVSLFSYDNRTLVVESFRDRPAQITVLAAPEVKKLRNLATGELLSAVPPPPSEPAPAYRPRPADPRSRFLVTMQPHSFVAYAAE